MKPKVLKGRKTICIITFMISVILLATGAITVYATNNAVKSNVTVDKIGDSSATIDSNVTVLDGYFEPLSSITETEVQPLAADKSTDIIIENKESSVIVLDGYFESTSDIELNSEIEVSPMAAYNIDWTVDANNST